MYRQLAILKEAIVQRNDIFMSTRQKNLDFHEKILEILSILDLDRFWSREFMSMLDVDDFLDLSEGAISQFAYDFPEIWWLNANLKKKNIVNM